MQSLFRYYRFFRTTKQLLLMGVVIGGLWSCSHVNEEDPQALIDATMAASGTANLRQCELEFIFRDRKYKANFNNGRFEYVRLFTDGAMEYRDLLTNDGFHRTIDGQKASIPDTMAVKYANSVNAVIYFALLPRGLNDKAVNKEYVGSKEIAGKDYHKVKITFDQEGGGEDFRDQFIYWINKEDHKIDYLAYAYHTDGGGMRFRDAYNERYIEGVRFVDYINYKPTEEILLQDIDSAFVAGELQEVSRIELEDIEVNVF